MDANIMNQDHWAIRSATLPIYQELPTPSSTAPLVLVDSNRPMRVDPDRQPSYSEYPGESSYFHSRRTPHGNLAEGVIHEISNDSSDRLSLWEPLYLKRWVLLGFSAIFIILVASLEAVYVYSRDHSGLTSTSDTFRYVWTYTPTAVFTLIAAIWMRVEYQMKLIAPWANMSQGPATSQHTIQLDYVSMIKIFSIWPAIKNKNYNVAFASLITISLQASIILSTGLFTLLPTKVEDKSVPIPIRSHFVDSTDGFKANSQLPAILVAGHQTSDLSYPLGLSDEIAYQAPERSTSLETTETVKVEGLSVSLDCEQPGNDQFVYAGNSSYSLTSRLWPNCTVTTFLSQSAHSKLNCLEYGINVLGSLIPASCSHSDSPDDQRVLAVWGNTVCPVPSPQDVSFRQVAVLLCRPKYSIQEVEVVYTPGQEDAVKVNRIPGAKERQLSTVHPWDIAQAQFDLFEWSSNPTLFSTNAVREAIAEQLQVDSTMAAALSLYANDTIPYAQLIDAQNLEQLVQRYYARMGAAIGHVALTGPSNDVVTGSTLVKVEQRLLVNALPVQIIVGLLVFSVALTVSLIAWTRPESVLLLHNPGSIIGIATHIFRSEQFVAGLRGQGGSNDASLQEHTRDWKVWTSNSDNSQYFVHSEDVVLGTQQTRNTDQGTWSQPLIIRPLSRILLCLLMAILILTLELLLGNSESHDGLATLFNIDFTHYLWTWLPALVVALLGLLVGAVEFVVVCYSPFWYLKSKEAIKLLDSNLLDNTRPILIMRAIQARSLVIALASAAVITSTFLNIFTASLFAPRTTSVETAGSLKILETFIPVNTVDLNTEIDTTMDLAAPLILAQNLSFPAMTTEDLVIPKLELVEQVDMTNASITARVPALQTAMDCTPYDTDDMKIRTGFSEDDGSPTMNITFPKTEMCLYFNTANRTIRVPASLAAGDLVNFENNTVLGVSGTAIQIQTGADTATDTGCQSDFYFAYGFYGGSPGSSRIRGLACKFTPKLVMANVTLIGPELQLDVQNTSYETDSISTPVNYLKAFGFFNQYLPSSLPASYNSAGTNETSLDGFFQLLISSFLSISLSDLADPTRSEPVAAAIRRQLTVIQTQNNRHALHPLDSAEDIADLIDKMDEEHDEGFLSPISVEQNTTQLIGDILNVHDTITKLDPAMGAIASNHLRLVQDPASTRVLQGLLGVILVCIGVVSIRMPTKAVLPREPTSIASVSALLADGDLLDHLPADTQSEKPRDYWWSWGRGLEFRLEWREDKTGSSVESLGNSGTANVEMSDDDGEIGFDELLVYDEEEGEQETVHSGSVPARQYTEMSGHDEKHVPGNSKFGIFVASSLASKE